MEGKKHLLIIGDSPTASTGFACVVRNLAKRWQSHFDAISIWGINYTGWPQTDYPYTIYPAGSGGWMSDANMVKLLNLINASDFTHIFLLHDPQNFSLGRLPELFRAVCDQKNIQLVTYFPVDSPLRKEWLRFPAACDRAVTMTEYGKREVQKIMPKFKVDVIGHGADPAVYFPREDRESIREQLFTMKDGKCWIGPDDFLIVGVSRNEKRKAPHHMLQILAEMLNNGVKDVKMLLHMPRMSNPDEGVDLEAVGEQLGLKVGVNWHHNDGVFTAGNAQTTEDGLNCIYNAADLYMTTTLAEGWGLPISEALLAGCPVVAPNNTACAEQKAMVDQVGNPNQFVLLPLAEEAVCNTMDLSRLRYPVAVKQSARIVEALIARHREGYNDRFTPTDAMKDWLSWDRIAQAFLSLMEVK